MPSSRSFCEKRGVWLFASPSGESGPGTFSLSRIDSANTHRSPVFESAAAYRSMPPAFSTNVVVPVRIASSAPTTVISVASSPCSRLPGWTGSFAEFGKPKSSLKPRCSVAVRCAWQLIEAGKDRLVASVVDVGVGILLEDLGGWTNRGNLVAHHRERHVVLNGIGVHHRRVRKDNGATLSRLGSDRGVFQEERGGTGAGQ